MSLMLMLFDFWLRQELKQSQCPSVLVKSCLEHSFLHSSLLGLTQASFKVSLSLFRRTDGA